MDKPLSDSARRVQEELDKHGLSFEVKELPESTRTANEAAKSIGCLVSQIAKSIIFKGGETGLPILAVLSGSNRADILKLADLTGETIENADADFVRQHTGFTIGGVPPVGHDEQIRTFLDKDLLQFEEIWAAAGTPHAVFKLHPHDLPILTGTDFTDIKTGS
ncbi:MAG: YbaK/EbsC family protein [Balneolaceae bacterium]|jgi:prolyl-tRNA editing enzyme YbaK/EbsC (Cys-tRNA(Pro) deacylase)